MSNQLKPSDASKRNRGSTTIDFQTASTGVAAKAMRNELNRMANNIQDPEAKRIFGAEMEDFFLLFNRYLTEKAKGEKMYVPLVRV
jgi:UTP--glucose-1-phosphate uridylyltransferase